MSRKVKFYLQNHLIVLFENRKVLKMIYFKKIFKNRHFEENYNIIIKLFNF